MQSTTMTTGWLGSLFLLLALALTGCDDDDDDDPVAVDFEVACASVSCFNVDVTDSFVTEEGTEFIICEWFCASFRDFDKVFVRLTFERRPDSCFELSSEFVADGIC